MKNFSQTAFARFFTGFPKLLLAGLLFSLPLAAFTGIFVLICHLTGFNNIIIAGLGIIPAMPFYAGLVTVIRKYAVEKQDVKVISTFFEAVKENFKLFLVHGAVAYIIAACALFSLLYYYSLSADSVVFGSVLTLYMLFSALLLIMMFYVPLMTVTYELRLRDIYRNSFLLIFGKILRNLVALFFVAVVTAAAFFALMFTEGVWFAVTVVLIAALYPLIAAYIINAVIAKGLRDTVGEFTGVSEEKEALTEDYELERQALENVGGDTDYVYVNGKMIKRNSDKENKTDTQE